MNSELTESGLHIYLPNSKAPAPQQDTQLLLFLALSSLKAAATAQMSLAWALCLMSFLLAVMVSTVCAQLAHQGAEDFEGFSLNPAPHPGCPTSPRSLSRQLLFTSQLLPRALWILGSIREPTTLLQTLSCLALLPSQSIL